MSAILKIQGFLQTHYTTIYLYSIYLMVISLPLSRFGLSIAQLVLLGVWLLEGRYKQKLTAIFSNKALLILISFYLLHLIGLLYTTDFQFGLKDIRVKLPLLFLPIVFATSEPLEAYKVRSIIKIFIAATLVSTLISFGLFLVKEVSDFRNLSPFISHIRLSLNVCLAILFAGYYIYRKQIQNTNLKTAYVIAIIWFVLFLVMIESISGLFILLFVIVVLSLYGILKLQSWILKLSSFILVITIPILIFLFLYNTASDFLTPHKNDLNKLEIYTEEGNPYYHDTINFWVENGSFTGLYICQSELREEWNKRSNLDFDGKDEKGQYLRFTLIRYLNSKELRKDARGVNSLTDMDIRYVEMGIANVVYTQKFHINSRLYKILWEYQLAKQNDNPGGHSVIQRLEFWKTSVKIIEKHPWFGVGTGDIAQAYEDQYIEMDSKLKPEFRYRAHNQFLATFVSFGILGLIWFLISLIYPAIALKKIFNYRYAVFWITIMLSMLVEDTLETQMGASLYAFFNAFLLFAFIDTSANKTS